MNRLYSIIVPVYNVSEFLKDCLDSLVGQDFKNFEIILVNDGSTDNSEEICKEYAERFPFIRYYRKENGGLSSARNFGIEKAVGEYLIFVDSDDFLTDNGFLSSMSDLISRIEVDFIAYLPIEYSFDRKTVVKNNDPCGMPLNRIINAKDVLNDLYSKDNPYTTMAQTKIIKRDYLLKNELFFTNGIYHEDDDWIVRVLFTYPKIYITDIVGYGYRHRENSIIHTSNSSKIFKRACDRILIAERVSKIPDILLYRKCLTFFSYYYIQAFEEVSKIADKKQEFLEYVNKTKFLKKMKYSLNRRHRIVSLYARLFGIKAANKFIIKKYARADVRGVAKSGN